MRFTVVAVASAGILAGCGTLPFSEGRVSDNTVRSLLRNQENSCRPLGMVEGHSTFGTDSDLYRVSLDRARMAVEAKAGNAMALRTYEVFTGKGPTTATVIAEAYVCPTLGSINNTER